MKKDAALLASLKDKFINGAVASGEDKIKVSSFWEELMLFAQYAFNASHAYSYGHLTYYTAWLKANYPNEFYCSIISCENEASTQRIYMEDAKAHGIKILPPNLNESDSGFTLDRNSDIIYGLSGIVNIGEPIYKQIIELRPFKSFGDFLLKTHLYGTSITKKAIDALIRSGSMDCFGYKRSVMLRSYEKFKLDFDPKKSFKREIAKNGEMSDEIRARYKEFLEKESEYFEDKTFKEFSLFDILEDEKNFIGVYISGDPMDLVVKTVTERHFTSEEVKSAVEYKGMFSGSVIAYISSVRALNTRTGKKMCFLDCIDHEGKRFSATVFDPNYTKLKDILRSGNYLQLVISAKPSYRGNGEIDSIVNMAIDLGELCKKQVREEEHKNKVKEAFIILDDIPSSVRFKSILNKVQELIPEDKFDSDGAVSIVVKVPSKKYDSVNIERKDSDFEMRFGPFYTKLIDVEIIRMLNKLPDVTIATR